MKNLFTDNFDKIKFISSPARKQLVLTTNVVIV